MRMCIEFGMHRSQGLADNAQAEYEMRKRLFWSCYTLDRQTAIVLGRPFAIPDAFIDVEVSCLKYS
jgi:Fungal specific transcription factor domain